MRCVGPSVAVFGRERGTSGGTQFVAEKLVFADGLVIGKLRLDGCRQCLRGVNLLDDEIHGGETRKVEVTILRVGGGGVVILSEEMKHTLAFVVKGNGTYLAVLKFELCHTFERSQRQFSFNGGIGGIVSRPYLLDDACTFGLPLVAHGDGGAVVAQFWHLKERATHDALKLGIAVEVDVRTLNAFVVGSYGEVTVCSQIAEYINSAVGTKVFQFDVEIGLVVMTL